MSDNQRGGTECQVRAAGPPGKVFLPRGDEVWREARSRVVDGGEGLAPASPERLAAARSVLLRHEPGSFPARADRDAGSPSLPVRRRDGYIER